ncbi:MAG: hypothetical protein HZA78_06525 [Candidatus Schekmanbacteria bacterium]|nr:hypothetical protein [Candidatus Schekmanbacteria bacterium]
MIQKMDKIQVIAPRSIMSELIQKVYDFGCLHVENPVGEEHGAVGSLKTAQLTEQEAGQVKQLENMSAQAEDMLTFFSQELEISELSPGKSGDEGILKKSVAEIAGYVKSLTDEFNSLKRQPSELKRSQNDSDDLVKTFSGLAEQAKGVTGKELLALSLVKKEGIVDLVKTKAHNLSEGKSEVFSTDLDAKNVAVIIAAPVQYLAKIKTELTREEGIKYPFSEENSGGSLKDVLENATVAAVVKKKSALPGELKALDSQMKDFGSRNQGILKKIQAKAAEELSLYGVVDKFAETKFTFVILGWIIDEKLDAFKKMIKDSFGNKVIIEELDIKEAEHKKVPVALKNNAYSKRFEVCLSAFRAPLYGGIDPTRLLSIFFPIIFGMILGDIGYGLIVLLIALVIKGKGKTNKALDDVGFVLLVCSISSIVFGFLFGEVLGTLGHFFGLRPILVNREHFPDLMKPFALTVGFGVFHIVVSLCCKAYISYKHHHSVNAHVVEAVSTIVIIFTLIAMLLIGAGVMPSGLMLPVGIIAVAALIALACSGGIAGTLEIFGTIGNILSYARIMAIGMQSVIMAMVANIIAVKAPSVVIGLSLCILIHVINLMLGLVGPTIHGLRLNFVESFTKFVKLEGIRYKPFGRGGEEIA